MYTPLLLPLEISEAHGVFFFLERRQATLWADIAYPVAACSFFAGRPDCPREISPVCPFRGCGRRVGRAVRLARWCRPQFPTSQSLFSNLFLLVLGESRGERVGPVDPNQRIAHGVSRSFLSTGKRRMSRLPRYSPSGHLNTCLEKPGRLSLRRILCSVPMLGKKDLRLLPALLPNVSAIE